MTITKAIGRLSWRFGKCTTIKPVQEDVDALNAVIDTINELSINTIASNQSFTKLYIKLYQITLDHYKSNIYEDLPQKQLIKFLEKPMYMHIENFTDFLNQSEMFKVYQDDEPDLKKFKEAQSKFAVDEVRVELSKTITACLKNLKE